MNVTDFLTGSENTSAIAQIARQFGISEEQAKQAIGSLTPSVTRGLQRRAEEEIGVGDIMDALGKGNHGRYLDEPAKLEEKATKKDGNAILGNIFGSKEVSRNVATHAAKETGLASTLMKKMLPIVASMVMASLGKKLLGGGASSAAAPAESGGLLTSLLDSDGDGSVIDDVLGMAFKAMLG
jgi:hypothetical protein